MTVYADILLLVNFSMDFLTLYLTGLLLHKPLRKKRMVSAAACGSAAGTAYALFEMINGSTGILLSILLGLLLAVGMVQIAFGKYSAFIPVLRDSLSVWGAGTLLGGIMTFLLSLGEPVYTDSRKPFGPVFAGCFVLSCVLIQLLSGVKSRKSASVTVEIQGTVRTFEALCDSGSFAADPISGCPVILVRLGVLRECERLLEQDDCPLRLRMIPTGSIGGERLLRGFVPDSVTVAGHETSAVIAIYNESKTFGGYDALLPAKLCS